MPLPTRVWVCELVCETVGDSFEEKLRVMVLRERIVPIQRPVHDRKRKHCHASDHEKKSLERKTSPRGRLHERCSRKTNRVQCFQFERLRSALSQRRLIILPCTSNSTPLISCPTGCLFVSNWTMLIITMTVIDVRFDLVFIFPTGICVTQL
jgi:hypothetical protein